MSRINTHWRFKAAKKPLLFEAIGTQRVGRTYCFLCGSRLRRSNRSDEHVFPNWLLNRYELWDATLTLLNGTRIPYRYLTIPCCHTCNTKHLSPLEDSVQKAVRKGPTAVERLSKRTLFLWLSKILYGVLYKEGLLPVDRRRPSAGRLVPRPLLETLKMHHYFLQAARLMMRFHGFFPASILIYRLQKHPDLRFQFNFRDLPPVMNVALQMGSVGILAALQDGGSQVEGFKTYLDRYRTFDLHPVQFLELIAKFFYKSTLLNRTPKYVITESTKAIEVFQLPLQGFSLKPVWDDWEQAAYAQHLSFHLRLPLEKVFQPPEQVATWLNGDDGEPRRMSLREYTWP